MKLDLESAQPRAAALHDEEEREKAVAMTFPEGKDRDAHWMRGERLSDEAWHIEETHDLDPRPTGLWKNA